MTGLFLYLLVINVLAFIAMGYDKSQARRKEQRVPEKSLFGLAAVGGALGAWFGMRVWRHKTRHASFVWGIPLLLIWNAVCVYYISSK